MRSPHLLFRLVLNEGLAGSLRCPSMLGPQSPRGRGQHTLLIEHVERCERDTTGRDGERKPARPYYHGVGASTRIVTSRVTVSTYGTTQ
jgi:hypothetical protein